MQQTPSAGAVLALALLLAGCSSVPPLDVVTTGSVSPRRAAYYEREPVPKGVTPDDWTAARAALSEALREDTSAPSVPWENYAGATRGMVTPLGPTTASAGKCRDFLMSFVGSGGDDWVQGEVCRSERGWWSVKEARLLERS